jgi:hypothetical protein
MFIKQIQNYGDADIYIHVDKKNSKMVNEIKKSEHVFVISEYEVRWASFEMMAATISLMKLILQSGNDYTHIYYGSGNDLLVRRGLYKYLSNHPDDLFMKIECKMDDSKPDSSRYRVKWPRKLMVRENWHPYRFIRGILHRLCSVGIIPLKNGHHLDEKITIYRGSQWFIVPYEVIEFFVSYISDNPDYLEFWKDVLAPDEFIFQTLAMNSRYKDKVKPSLMYIDVVDTLKAHNHPKTITMDDIKKIDEAETCFAARKFDLNEDEEVIRYYVNNV